MDPNTPPVPKKSWLRWPSTAFWVQAGACAVVTWSLMHGALTAPPPSPRAPGNPGTPAAVPPAPVPAASLAAVPSLGSAALSTIDVIVARNDTLDHIFRRLKLNLADLASLRSLPNVRQALDSLQPGESLHFEH